MPDPTARRWHSLRVYYYDEDKDALLLEAVRPMFHRLRGHADAAWFERHWLHGPHLRLHVRTDPGTFARVVRPAADELVGAFLARHPSIRRLDPQAELAAHCRLAELEHEPGPLLPWHPDNSIQPAPPWSPTGWGGPAAAELVADFAAATTGLAFAVTEAARGPARLALAFDLMIATAHALHGAAGVQGGFVSFRSHAEGFLYSFPEAAGLRPFWDRHYRATATTLTARVRAVVAALDEAARIGSGADLPGHPDRHADGVDRSVPWFAVRFVAVALPFRDRAARLARAGALALPSLADAAIPTDVPDPAAAASTGAGLSPFHQRLLDNPGWPALLAAPDFQANRLMVNLTYLLLTRLGVAPAQRFLLCHLAANAVEDCYDTSAYELVGRAGGAAGSTLEDR